MKILGLDLGTNSVGWAVVEKDGEEFTLLKKGVRIFQEGVKIEKGIEGSKAAERTGFRSARRLKFRRKLRKIETLRVLSDHGYCPKLTEEELRMWRYDKVYPNNPRFREWLLTNEEQNNNPYYFRYLAANELLDQTIERNRYAIGRAIYHIAQRRGFKSNRLESTKENIGVVKIEIAEINEKKGDNTLGQYFYEKYIKGEKIRNTYTHREEHYLDEFVKISNIQKFSPDFISQLKRAIFFQRPLKSQKGLIGKCPFEKNKNRCPVSRPEFEEYRMLSFVNNIKIKGPDDEKLRFLNNSEKETIIPLFYRKSKEHFDFEDIAKKLAPKHQYKYFRSGKTNPEDWLFNYHMKTSISGCPVSARLKELFGDEFMQVRFEYNRLKDNKNSYIDIDDIWHVLYTYDDEEKLKNFARIRLGFDDEKLKNFLGIKPRHEYASLSLKAIKKVLPYLREGLIYSHAIFLANMSDIIPALIWKNEENKRLIRNVVYDIITHHNDEKQITEIVNGLIKLNKEEGANWSEQAERIYRNDLVNNIEAYYGKNKYAGFPADRKSAIETSAFNLFKVQMQKNQGKGQFAEIQRIDERIKAFLQDNFNVENSKLDKLYHPSAIEIYKPPVKGDDGKHYLNTPMVASIRNPMAMRALHQLRKAVNELIREDIIDANTKVNIEMSRGLLNANERKGLQDWQRENEKKRKDAVSKIKEHFGSEKEPSQDEILKYQLWEEQKHKCLFTGAEIGLSDFLGANPKYDIEHTIPRSLSFDNSQANKTICENVFNRSVKRNKIPFELPNHSEILERIEHWKENVDELDKQINSAVKQSGQALDKEAKDRAIQKRHKLKFERDYWWNKYNRFMMKDVPDGFKNSQLVDTGIITKYSRLYLKTLFDSVYTVKGNTVADFRKIWGLQDEYEKKERVNHIHHCIDAITIACITKDNYERLAKFYHDWEELAIKGIEQKPKVKKPWQTFVEDVAAIEDEILISHHTQDVLPKQSKKKLRKRGKIQYNNEGKPIYQKGDTVRGSLHKETFYGAIEQTETLKNGEKVKQIKFVVRKPLDTLDDGSLKNIVDERVREIVINARKEEKELRTTIEQLKKNLQTAEEWEEDGIRKQIEDVKMQIENLYSLPAKNGDRIPIKKVRVFQPTVTSPLKIKKQRDKRLKNPKPYKEDFYAVNDGNHVMAIYEGIDPNGKIIRDFHIVNNLEAGEFFKYSTQKVLKAQGLGGIDRLVPSGKKKGKMELKLKAFLKIGTMVILWEKLAEEVWELSEMDLRKRLYKIIGLSNQKIKSSSGKLNEYATIVMRFHQEATPASDLKVKDGLFVAGEEYKAQRKLNHNQFNALIEGFDFELTTLGEIKRLR
ncbi:MAG: HNH endonuclease domain-containing protein [Bacteroidales bacterium]|nr:HNH endonuclease domain-containing protein [Bacteroidales bacterium]